MEIDNYDRTTGGGATASAATRPDEGLDKAGSGWLADWHSKVAEKVFNDTAQFIGFGPDNLNPSCQLEQRRALNQLHLRGLMLYIV